MIEPFPSPAKLEVNPPFRSGHRSAVSHVWNSLYSGSSWLTMNGILMIADIVICLLGLIFDPTIVTNAPVWLKPLKFGISTFLFSLTVAYFIGQMQRLRGFASFLGKLIAAALVIEIVLIDMQAARHTTSHFNVADKFDGQVYAVMGISIAILYAGTALLFVLTCFSKFAGRGQALAIRLGLLIALFGMGTGVLMTLPTPQQLALAQKSGALRRVGAHTVGAPDGGRSMPFTGWSADHGDLRIAHFLGLHAMQILLLGWWLTRRQWSHRRQIRLILALAVSSTFAFAVVLLQALHGQPFLHPGRDITLAWLAWLGITAAGLAWTTFTSNSGTSAMSIQLEGIQP